MASSPFKQALDMGYGSLPIIPLRPRSKVPFIQGWSKYCTEMPSQEDMAEWGLISNANVGLALGEASGVIALDFDHNVEDLHERIMQFIPVSPVRKVGARGYTMFYKFNGELPHKWARNGAMVLELLSTGNHTVLPPSVHPDGPTYRFSSLLPLVGNRDRLQTLPANFKDLVDAALGVESGELGRSVSVGALCNDLHSINQSEVKAALEYVDPEDYEVWLKIGMALKEELDIDGFTIWAEWSKRSAKCIPNELLPKWNSFKKDGVGLGTLFYYAQNNGYNRSEPALDTLTVKFDQVRETIDRWRKYGKPVGESFGWKSMDNLLHVRKGEFTIVTGYTNEGKSEFIDSVAMNLIKLSGWKVGFISMEKSKETHVMQLIHKYTEKRLEALSDEELGRAYKEVPEKAIIIDHINLQKDISKIADVIEFLGAKGVDSVIIDPFNYIDSTEDSLYSHVMDVCKMCANLAKKRNIHIFLVAHAKDPVYNKDGQLQKPRRYSVFGGTQFSNLVDNLIGVTRIDNTTKVETLKVRDQDCDTYGTITLQFNKEERKFYEPSNNHQF